ncbi:MAG: VCBS repeat-containing protein [Phycisphaerales bacterium]|nr:VCBS repeat-containing protein [Phycisphaerales bacterium]
MAAWRRETARFGGAGALLALISGAPAGPPTTPPAFSNLTLYGAADGARSIAIADLDGDGDLDILVASANDNRVAWLENDGLSPPGFTHRAIASAATGAQQVVCVDVDGDGRPDALSAAFGANRIAWHQNTPGAPGAPPTFVTRTITTNAMGAQSAAGADLSGDGVVDVAAASFSDNKVAWHEQVPAPADPPGQPPTWITRTISTNIAGASSIVAVDLDLDGDVDLVVAAFSSNRIVWFENTPGAGMGAPRVFIERTLTSSAPGVIALHAADMDGDGDIDLVAACFNDNSVRLYENLIAGPGMGPPMFEAVVVDAGANGPVGVSSYDLDGDGDLDVLSASLFGNAVAWHERRPGAGPGDPPVFVKHTIATGMGAPRLALGADLDADGDRDVVSCSQNLDRVTLHDNIEPRVFNLTSGSAHQTVQGALTAAAAGDTIEVSRPGWIGREQAIDFAGRRARVQTVDAFAAGASIVLADRAALAAAPGEPMSLTGAITSGLFQRVTLEGAEVLIGAGGSFHAGPGAFLEIDSAAPLRIGGQASVAGSLLTAQGVSIQDGGSLAFAGFAGGPFDVDGALTVSSDGTVFGGATVGEKGTIDVSGAALTIGGGAEVNGTVSIAAVGRTDDRAADGLLVQGAVEIGENGVLETSGGTLTIDGGLTLLGAPRANSDRPATIGGALIAGQGAALEVGGAGSIEARGNIDVAIDDGARFDVAGRLVAAGPGARTLEAMSVDVGPSASGLDTSLPGRFPIGALTVRAGATVNLVDAHDNAKNGAPPSGPREALYVAGTLTIEASGRLNVGDHRVYYGQLVNLGTIDHPANLKAIGSCPGDITGDSFVGFADLNVIVSNFNVQGEPGTLVGDIDGDGLVGFSDLNIVVSAFNSPC